MEFILIGMSRVDDDSVLELHNDFQDILHELDVHYPSVSTYPSLPEIRRRAGLLVEITQSPLLDVDTPPGPDGERCSGDDQGDVAALTQGCSSSPRPSASSSSMYRSSSTCTVSSQDEMPYLLDFDVRNHRRKTESSLSPSMLPDHNDVHQARFCLSPGFPTRKSRGRRPKKRSSIPAAVKMAKVENKSRM
ncbi:hypothetical protein QCA50_001631 [Cerrena zonata]|uniref:Uncharacterized protein n=1 Tax=Cerrena zonata TaxID=2478898 RepID=A0AAW0GTN0_9APHY